MIRNRGDRLRAGGSIRLKATHYSDTIKNFARETDPDYDPANRPTYMKQRQQDAIAFAIKEREFLQKQALLKLKNEQYEQQRGERPYQRSIERFPQTGKSRMGHSGSAENRIIQTWENIWFNWIRRFFKHQYLIGKDRQGNRFFSEWSAMRPRHEIRMCIRLDKSLHHIPYGHDGDDCRHWYAWMRHHRGEPPTVAEEEFLRHSKKAYAGPVIHEHESFEDGIHRAIAQIPEMSGILDDRDFQTQDQDNMHRQVKPSRIREQENPDPDDELGQRERELGQGHSMAGGRSGKTKATWHQAFVRPDLFFNEEETEVMRFEIQNMFKQMEWQDLEYRRQVRRRNAQPPHGLNEAIFEHGDINPQQDAEPMQMHWDRLDLGIPYHDAVPDLTSPELERLRLEAEQLEEQRHAIRCELGLTDLGDIREGRPPIDKGDEPYRRPVSKNYKPKVWDETWGQSSFRGW
jgi:hypothetical protein